MPQCVATAAIRTVVPQPAHGLSSCLLELCCQDAVRIKDPPEPQLEPPTADAVVALGDMFFTKPEQLLQVGKPACLQCRQGRPSSSVGLPLC